MKAQDICALIESLARPECEKLGLLLWDVEYVKEGGQWFLRVYVDRPEGVSLKDCETVNRRLNALIDELDPIENAYLFEVSSAGVERTLKKQEHFDTQIGSEILVRFFKPEDGVKEITGFLKSRDDTALTLDVNGEQIKLDNNKIALVRLYFRF